MSNNRSQHKRQDGAAVRYQDDSSSWLTEEGKAVGEWIELRWVSPVLVQSIRLVGVPPTGGDWRGFGEPAASGPYSIERGQLQLALAGEQQGDTLAVGRVEPLTNGGTLITLDEPVEIDQLRFIVDEIAGRWWYQEIAALSEIEVIGMAAAATPPTSPELTEQLYLPTVLR